MSICTYIHTHVCKSMHVHAMKPEVVDADCPEILFTQNLVFHLFVLQVSLNKSVDYTINGEKLAGLNFCIFCSFQEYHESFYMNIYTNFV